MQWHFKKQQQITEHLQKSSAIVLISRSWSPMSNLTTWSLAIMKKLPTQALYSWCFNLASYLNGTLGRRCTLVATLKISPQGKIYLDTELRKMCSLASIEGAITNHNLRATSTTQMFDVGVTEEMNTGENRAQVTGRPCKLVLAFFLE